MTEERKVDITEEFPNIQIGGMPESSSTEHLVTAKTWMKHLEEKKENGIFQTFDLEKFFDKESLLDTMDTLKREARISDKCYRLWYKLNENASVAVSTSVGTSEFRTVKNSVGQGMFGAALASSLNIGCAINTTFRGMTSASIGAMTLNCVVMQDDIAKMNDNINDARIGCSLIDETLKKKQKLRPLPSCPLPL